MLIDKPIRDNQIAEAEFWKKVKRMFNNSDPGTGKTRSTLEGYTRSIKGRLLVVAPLSILRSSWGDDIDEFFPDFTWAVAHGTPKKRLAAFKSDADIVITNHDGVNWLVDRLELLKNFSHGVLDEYPVFKNRTTKRSKNCLKCCNELEYLSLLSGTPNSNTITDLWHPTFILDHGLRLGREFFKFRGQVCAAEQVGPDKNMVKWHDKTGASDQVTALLSDITIRHELTDIPENVIYNMYVDMPKDIMAQYRQLEREAVLSLESGVITAINAGIKTKKILQLLSGAVYDANGGVVKVHSNRHQLVMDLVTARDQCVIAFNYKHERDGLITLAERLGFTYGVLDGDTRLSEREKTVRKFQIGKLKLIFAHPQSAAHGLTLTAGTTTIWTSPTYNAEHFKQFNRRIHRTGQNMKTETICICARDTKEEDVYQKLTDKIVRLDHLLDLFSQITQAA